MNADMNSVEIALQELRAGKMIILTDDPTRENEGDLIMAAEKITPEAMNFMIRQGTGIVCLAMTEPDLARLQLPLMVPQLENTSCRGTPFTISIDAKKNISTGVSAADRCTTILAAIADEAQPDDLVRPGHVFPLKAQNHGVLQREGHTEGAVDLARLAGLKPAAVLCEIMNADGSMCCGQALTTFAKQHALCCLSIAELIDYRQRHESLILESVTTTLPLKGYGTFKMLVVKEKVTLAEHVVLIKEPFDSTKPPLVRIHSKCSTGDIFQSKRCDCHEELHFSLQQISTEGGILIYLEQEGRGIGLFNKTKAYVLQDQGYDTVEANQQLGFPADARHYAIAANVLHQLNITEIRLLTHNPEKIKGLQRFDIKTNLAPLPVFKNEINYHYLKIKQEKLNHQLNL